MKVVPLRLPPGAHLHIAVAGSSSEVIGGRIGGRRAWFQGQAQQHHQILRAQDELWIGG